MVVFTCSHCGDSVRKNQVEKHYQFSCRGNFPSLTCVDCLKDFNGNEHVSHTSCVTEEERYSAKGFVSKPPSDKGKKKQQNWIDFIRNVVESNEVNDISVKCLLEQVVKDPGVPTKKAKFINYCKNKRFNTRVAESAWNFIEIKKQEFNKVTNSPEDSLNGSQTNLDDTAAGEDRKRKRVDSCNGLNIKAESKKEKKKKLATENNDLNAVVEKNVSNDGNDDELKEAESEENGVCDVKSKMSKKEKKEKRKKEKYEKELLEVQIKPAEIEENVSNGNAQLPGKKKKKKNRHENACIEESELPTGSKIKSKAQPQDEENEIENGDQEDQNEESSEIIKPSKFNWEETVIKLLESKGELPLKRVEKKVVNEYMNSGAHIESIEKVVAKFNKKILKMSRVKVKKDMVKLVL